MICNCLYYYLKSSEFQTKIREFSSGSVAKQIPIRDLSEIEINFIPLVLQNILMSKIEVIDQKIELNLHMNRILNQLRDLLLPQLISGRLHIKDPDKFLEGLNSVN